jgi:hypothetical protein
MMRIMARWIKAATVLASARIPNDVACTDRVGDSREHETVRVACSKGATAALEWARMTSGASATNSAAYLRGRFGRRSNPRVCLQRYMNPFVSANGPN